MRPPNPFIRTESLVTESGAVVRWFVVAIVCACSAVVSRAENGSPTLGPHPRILATAERILAIKRDINRPQVSPVLSDAYRREIAAATEIAERGPRAYFHDPKDREQLWQRDVGDEMSVLAFAWLLTGEHRFLEAVEAWSRAVVDYPQWGEKGEDLAAGHLMFGLAVAYDWCGALLPEELSVRIERTLVERGRVLFRPLERPGWWGQSYLQNHLWVNGVGLLAAAIAIGDREPETLRWAEVVRARIQQTFRLLGDDGASHEGIGYWTYGADALLRYMEIVRDCYGDDEYKSAWWRNTARYCLAFTLPRGGWTRGSAQFPEVAVDLEDCARFFWYGPDHILHRLAAEYRDGYAQAMAWELERGGGISSTMGKIRNPWLNLLWLDPQLPPANLNQFRTLQEFPDMGLVSSRTSWDQDASLVVVKCGPPLGHLLVPLHDDVAGSSSHVHPDAGTFCIHGNGRYLIRNAGYSTLKLTAADNSLLIDGKGQAGEGQRWFYFHSDQYASKGDPTLTVVSSSADADYILADATSAYDPSLGIRRFQRHVIFLKRISAVILLDDIEVSRSADLALNFHPEVPATIAYGSRTVISQDDRAVFWLTALNPTAHVSVANANEEMHETGSRTSQVIVISYPGTTRVWNAVGMSWCASGNSREPVKISVQHDDGTAVWTLMADGMNIGELNPERRSLFLAERK